MSTGVTGRGLGGHWGWPRSHLGVFLGPGPIFSSLLTVPLQQDQRETSAPKPPPSLSRSSHRSSLSHSLL